MRVEDYNSWQQFVLVLVRFAVGWHLFFQGLGKLRSVGWSAKGYLEHSWGPLAPFFRWLAESETLLWLADKVTVWALMILGLLLMLGLFTRLAAVGGGLLVLLFFLAAPPVTMMGFSVPTTQGSELYVDKTLIEVLVFLIVVSFPTGQMAGLDILFRHYRGRRNARLGRVWS